VADAQSHLYPVGTLPCELPLSSASLVFVLAQVADEQHIFAYHLEWFQDVFQ
jgi:hypothetical protein